MRYYCPRYLRLDTVGSTADPQLYKSPAIEREFFSAITLRTKTNWIENIRKNQTTVPLW